MKQGNASNADFDLDDLERQLAAAAAPRKVASDDPLAELARIIGQDSAASSRAGQPKPYVDDFEDFLRAAPRSVSGGMPAHTPPIEPLFSVASPQPPAAPVAAAPVDAPEAVASMRPALGIDSLDGIDAPAGSPIQASGGLEYSELEARLADAVKDEPSATFPQTPDAVPDALPPASQPMANFDDLLAEFDKAMRDAQPVQAPAGAAPIAVPAAPMDAFAPASHGLQPVAFDPAADAAEILDPGLAAPPRRSRRGLMLAAGVVGVALVGVGGLLALGAGGRMTNVSSAPVIAAKPGVMKERPANPGGVEVPNQDKEVLQSRPLDPKQAEKVAPREEQPLDLTQAQRTAESQNGVRTIPGVSIVAPITVVPPNGAAQQPAPRPVASVPITIGSAPSAPAPAASTPAPVAPPATPSPTASLGTVAPTPPAAATTANQVAPPPAASQSPPSSPAAAAPASTEPRRVRAVPIRPDDGAPSRAQPQPRVVPANPRPAVAAVQPAAPAAEPEDPNAPLRITPQSGRVPDRVAAAPPPGLVPSSTPSQGAPTTTQTTPDARSAGGGFAVQIGAEGSEDAARAKFNRMRGQYGSVLGSYSPTIRTAEVNGRSVYRVRVGSMSREEAASLCERLKASGGSCFVARN